MKNFVFSLVVVFSGIAFPAVAGEVKIHGGQVGCIDEVSGPGEVSVQHSDCTSTHHSAGGKKTTIGGTKRSQSVADQKYSNFGCEDWNRQLNEGQNLDFEKGPMAKSQEALLLVAYIQGALDAQERAFDRDRWDAIVFSCKDNPKKTLAEALKSD